MSTSRACTLLCGLLLAGCSESAARGPDTDGPPPMHRSITSTDVALDAGLADLCAVRSSFEVDPTREEPNPWLAAIASCIRTGPLQGRSLELVAHTSVHHDSAYARRVGESRADSLRVRLIENGMSADEVRSSAAVVGDERSVEVRIAARPNL